MKLDNKIDEILEESFYKLSSDLEQVIKRGYGDIDESYDDYSLLMQSIDYQRTIIPTLVFFPSPYSPNSAGERI